MVLEFCLLCTEVAEVMKGKLHAQCTRAFHKHLLHHNNMHWLTNNDSAVRIAAKVQFLVKTCKRRASRGGVQEHQWEAVERKDCASQLGT